MSRETLIHTLKFADPLADLVAEGRKYTTWRLNNERDLQPNDTVRLLHNSSGRLFGRGVITDVRNRTFGTLSVDDYAGHEKFVSVEDMLATYANYYSQFVALETAVTVVHFDLSLVCNRPGSDETDVIIVGRAA